jgi:hypothetical protein
MNPSLQPQEERSLKQLFSDLTYESSELVRKEIQLAKAEFSESVSELKTGVAAMAISAPLLFAGFLVLLVAAVLGLDEALHRPWLSALVVGGAVTVLGAVALLVGRSRVAKVDVTPERSARSLRDDKEMVQSHVSDPH